MTDDERRAAFAVAFFRQARSDWMRYRAWAGSEPEPCHSLHYLQMSCEKLAKAYRLRDPDSPLDDLLTSHVGFEKLVGTFVLVTLGEEYRGRDAQKVST